MASIPVPWGMQPSTTNMEGKPLKEPDYQRRFRIIVSDEETGEEVATATGVETLVLLASPDTLRGDDYRRILLGNAEQSAQLLFDIVKAVTDRVGRGTLMNLDDLLDDRLLLEVTEGLPLH